MLSFQRLYQFLIVNSRNKPVQTYVWILLLLFEFVYNYWYKVKISSILFEFHVIVVALLVCLLGDKVLDEQGRLCCPYLFNTGHLVYIMHVQVVARGDIPKFRVGFNPDIGVFMKNPVFSIKPYPGIKSGVLIKTEFY